MHKTWAVMLRERNFTKIWNLELKVDGTIQQNGEIIYVVISIFYPMRIKYIQQKIIIENFYSKTIQWIQNILLNISRHKKEYFMEQGETVNLIAFLEIPLNDKNIEQDWIKSVFDRS